MKKRIAYSYGMMDLVHYGHIRALKKAKENADWLIFGLVSDSASESWFGSHISNEEERLEVLKGIKFIDEIIPQQTFDPLDNLKMIHEKYPNAIITLYHSNEWGFASAREYVESIGGSVVKTEYYDKMSPQKIFEFFKNGEEKKQIIDGNLISTKANTLLSLSQKLKRSKIEKIHIITFAEYFKEPEIVAKCVTKLFDRNKIIVRSSSKHEDAFNESNAGHFSSVLNVDGSDEQEIMRAINNVFNSYGESIDDNEQVLIQKQTDDVEISGVVFTRDIQKNRPYYVINFDEGGSTNSVTSGLCSETVWFSYSLNKKNIPDKWKKLMNSVYEIVNILPGIYLDIEFAITKTKEVVIFQVRPLAAAYKYDRNSHDYEIDKEKKESIEQYKQLLGCGLTCFSDMAFWNPAEIIGDNPRFLDYSLYREIITKKAWNDGLLRLGYRKVEGDLMYRFGNKPYINLEKSFEALMPNNFNDDLVIKLRDYYITELKKDLSSHDKIEFEISHNCFDFALHDRLLEIRNHFDENEIENIEKSLASLTFNIIKNYKTTLSNDLIELNQLEVVRKKVERKIQNNNNDSKLIANSIKELLISISKYGTPQFSRQARCAFIAKSICKSLCTKNYIEQHNLDEFFSSINTVAVEYYNDYQRVLARELSEREYRNKYGHLRAGTYDIRSPRYDQMDNLINYTNINSATSFSCNNDLEKKICEAFERAAVDVNLQDFDSSTFVFFVKTSIEQREYFKFIFTKSLSYAIELMKYLGNLIGVSVKDLSYLEVPDIYSALNYSDVHEIKEMWNILIEKRKELFKVRSLLILPSVVCEEKDFDYIETLKSRPNYITNNKATGQIILLDEKTDPKNVADKIVVIESADPGYDWIFSKHIIGLITKYGGAASHMAIRCAEFKIPAAIGCGSAIFDYVCSSKELFIDCKKEKIIRLK